MRVPFNSNFRTTQVFGVNPAAYARFGMKGHNGIDYGLPAGTPVVAAHGGTAYRAVDPEGFGNYVTVQDGNLKTIYAHLSRFDITNGQAVTEGQQIGLSGNTGNSTGAHLHFGVKPNYPDTNNGFLGWVNPQTYLDATNQQGEQLLDKDAIRYAYLAVMDAEPTPDALKYWTGRKASELLKALYNESEKRRFKANKYDGVLAQAKGQADQIRQLNGANDLLTARIAELEQQLAAVPTEETEPGAQPELEVDNLSPDQVSKVRSALKRVFPWL